MRIACDIAALTRGGAERQLLELSSGLCDRGHDLLLIVNKAAEEYGEYLTRVPIRQLHRTGRYDVRVFWDIRRALREFRPDVCLCVLFNATLWGRMAAASLGCRVVVAEHSTLAVTSSKVLWTNRLLNGVTEAVVACADAQVESLVRGGHAARKIVVVRNGVDADRFTRDDHRAAHVRDELGVPKEAFVISLVAAHRPEKRHDRFIRLLERLDDIGSPAWGLMVGGGPGMEQTRRLACASRVACRLVVTGPRTDMRAVYSASDVVVLVSDDVETFPLSFLEAQSCGVPVVGLDIGGVRETMVDGKTGHVIPGDDLEEMALIVAALLRDTERRLRMGQAARQFVSEELSRTSMLDRYEDVLEGPGAVARGGRDS